MFSCLFVVEPRREIHCLCCWVTAVQIDFIFYTYPTGVKAQ